MTGLLRSARVLALRVNFYPFAATTCALIGVTGFFTLTATGRSITTHTLQQVGWAPRDLVALDIGRMLFSALVTNGGLVFWMALALTALFVGLAEHYAGSPMAAATFWGVHLATLGVMLAVSLPLHLAGDSLGTLVYATRDVGPSAGYVGCLGLAIVCSKRRERWWVLGATAVVLATVLARSLWGSGTEAIDVSANLAHAVALPIGASFGLLYLRRTRQESLRANRSA